MGTIAAFRADRLEPFLTLVSEVVQAGNLDGWKEIVDVLSRVSSPPALDRPPQFWANLEPYTKVSWHTRGSYQDVTAEAVPDPKAPELRWLLAQLIEDSAVCRLDIEEPSPRMAFESVRAEDGFSEAMVEEHEVLMECLFSGGGFPQEFEVLDSHGRIATAWLDPEQVRGIAELERKAGLLKWLSALPPEWRARDYARIFHALSLGAVEGWSLYYVNDK